MTFISFVSYPVGCVFFFFLLFFSSVFRIVRVADLSWCACPWDPYIYICYIHTDTHRYVLHYCNCGHGPLNGNTVALSTILNGRCASVCVCTRGGSTATNGMAVSGWSSEMAYPGTTIFSPMAHETTHTVAELNAWAIQQRIRIRSRSSRGNPSPSVRFNFGSLALLPSTRYPICLYRETYEYIYVYICMWMIRCTQRYNGILLLFLMLYLLELFAAYNYERRKKFE